MFRGGALTFRSFFAINFFLPQFFGGTEVGQTTGCRCLSLSVLLWLRPKVAF